VSKYGYRKSPQYAGFAAYMDAPFSELPADDHGRDDPRKMCFLDMGVPEELIFFLWQASRRAALEEIGQALTEAGEHSAYEIVYRAPSKQKAGGKKC
jgi:hypothetical protein